MDRLKSKVNVISLNEHWLDTKSINLLNQLDDFKIADYYARAEQCRGGSCIMINKNVSFKIREDLKFLNEPNYFEGSFVEIKQWNSIFLSIYRIPGDYGDTIFLDKFKILLDKWHVRQDLKTYLFQQIQI